MAEDQIEVSRVATDFYRQGFGKILIAIFLVLAACVLLSLISAYLFLSKPQPVVFAVDNEWRVLAPVPINLPYIKDPDLVQWVSTVLPEVLTIDFVNYQKEVQTFQQYFSENGWKQFSIQLDKLANEMMMTSQKMFLNTIAAGAPNIYQRGVSAEGRYVWKVQMPLKLSYTSPGGSNSKVITFSIYVVRIPTLHNLDGITIDDISVLGEGANVTANG